MNFLSKYFHSQKKRSEIGAVCASSSFLAQKIISPSDIQKARVIVELGAGTGIFTKRIFDLVGEKKKEIFIIEKDADFYHILIKKFPHHQHCILNRDVLELGEILAERGIESVDVVISSLPFKSLPFEVFTGVMEHFLGKFSHSETIFKQFSYFPSTKIYQSYFGTIQREFCLLNIPPANVFTCTHYKK